MATQTSVLGLSKPAGNENALVSVLNSDMELIDAEAGKVRNNIAATYSASSSYAVGDLCIYNGILYKCNTAIGSGGETWNASHWTQITIDGELTALNGKMPKIKSFDKTETIPDSGVVDVYIAQETGGVRPVGAFVKLGNNYPLPYYSGNNMTYMEILNDQTLRIRNNVSGWGSQTVHITLYFA